MGKHRERERLLLPREELTGPLGPPPRASSPGVARSMRANRAADTKLEIALRKGLWTSGVRGYRTNWRGVPGRPDVAFTRAKLAIFVHGCYWHRCPTCNLPLPRRHQEFWRKKFSLNVTRDREKMRQLEALGWRVLVLWECEIRASPEAAATRVKIALSTSGLSNARLWSSSAPGSISHVSDAGQ